MRFDPNKAIILTGMMGTGKSHIGRLLAQGLGRVFYDSDHEIEAAAGMQISEIFERYGEAYFREGEERVIARLLQETNSVLSTGGGAVLSEKTQAIIYRNPDVLSVWLRASVDELVKRIGKSNKRPLLAGKDPASTLQELLDARQDIYAQADIIIDTNGRSPQNTVEYIIEKLQGGQ